jgi:hypothetical protein
MALHKPEKLDATGASSMKTYDVAKVVDNDFFQGTWNVHQDEVSKYDPFISGYAFIYWTKLPTFMNSANIPAYYANQLKLGSYKMGDLFKHMTVKNFKALDGIGDIELSAEAITAGFTGNEMQNATGITKGNTEFTLKHQELAGSPIRLMYQYWVEGIRDFDTGIATYQGQTDLAYSQANHTGELLYIVTDPSGGHLQNSIEFAAYFTNVFPTRVPMGHLNYQAGEHGFSEIDIPFKGIMHVSNKVNELAAKNIKKIANFRTSMAYDPGFTEETSPFNNLETLSVNMGN